ncbi:hypothetical protein TI04_07225 [Achromatium sp. WMS2]|nr:hypothetical protein TI04_07225 [Achromatium sp. WMS2]
MTWIDYGIVGIIGISALSGLFRGLIREALSTVVWILALWLAWYYFRTLADYLRPWIGSQSIRLAVAFVIAFLIVVIVGGLVGMLLGLLVDKSGLSFIDQLLGAVFGIARGVMLVTILVLLGELTTLPKEDWWRESQLIGNIQHIAAWIVEFLPPDIARYFRP